MPTYEKTFSVFVNRYREITKADAEKRFDYFNDLTMWLEDAPRGTAQKLSLTLGYNKFWASNNVKPLKTFGPARCKKLLFTHDWPWGEVVLLSSAKADRRDRLLERALAGEDRKTVVQDVFKTFQGSKVANKNMRAEFFDSVSAASPSQIVKWFTDYLRDCPKSRAISILKGLAVVAMRFAPPAKRAA